MGADVVALVEELWTQGKGLVNPKETYQFHGRWTVFAVCGAIPMRWSLVFQYENYGFIWTGLLILITAGKFFIPGAGAPRYLCSAFCEEWSDMRRVLWVYGLFMQFLTKNTLGTLLDSLSLMCKGFLVLENVHGMQGHGNGRLHEALALVIMIFASAEVATPSVSLLVMHKFIPKNDELQVTLAFTITITAVLVFMYLMLNHDNEFKKLQRRFVWAGLWAQLYVPFLSDVFNISFKILSLTLLMLSFCSRFF